MKKALFALCTFLTCLVPRIAMAADPAPFGVVVSGSGAPMILIPGLASGGNVWDGTVAHFKDHYECHVLTLAGFGGQPPMDGPFLTKVRDGIISYIHDKKLNHPIIIGHSLGGMMAFWLAETAPDDLGPVVAVDGVPFYAALMDPAATPTSVTPAAERLRVAYAAMPTDQYVTANHKFLSSMITTPANVDMVASLGDKSNPKAVGQAFYDLFTTDLRPDLKNIKVPVLLIGASQAMADDAMKERVRTAYAAQIDTIPHHKLVFAPTARHFVQLDNPDFFYTEVETFLKENQK